LDNYTQRNKAYTKSLRKFISFALNVDQQNERTLQRKMIQNNTINNEIQDQFSKYILIVVEYCLINNQEILEVSDKRCDRNK
jgi:dephospho-CoA kinase